MCKRPLKTNLGFLVACRDCTTCRSNKVRDYVGRCLAEAQTSTKALAVTLTYADNDNPSAAILNIKDVQDFIKRLRKKYKVRYIGAGEYGSKKGRAHWHLALFFKGDYPKFPKDQNTHWDKWPHGHVHFQEPDFKGYYYILKYILKGKEAGTNVNKFLLSKKPPLGDEWLRSYAKEFAAQRLSPQNFEFRFHGVNWRNGDQIKFFLTGVTRDNFLEYYKKHWANMYDDKPKFSEKLMEYEARRDRYKRIEEREKQWHEENPEPENQMLKEQWFKDLKELGRELAQMRLMLGPGT
jgi:hypothetical protein